MEKDKKPEERQKFTSKEAFEIISSYGYGTTGTMRGVDESDEYRRREGIVKRMYARAAPEWLNDFIKGSSGTERGLDQNDIRKLQKTTLVLLIGKRKLVEAEKLRQLTALPTKDMEEVALEGIEDLVNEGHLKEAVAVSKYLEEGKGKAPVLKGIEYLISKGSIKGIETAADACDRFGMRRDSAIVTKSLVNGVSGLIKNSRINYTSKMDAVMIAIRTFNTKEEDKKAIGLDAVEYFIGMGNIGIASDSVARFGINKEELVGLLEKIKTQEKENGNSLLRKD